MPRTLGVLGGLGPWATLYFFEQVLRLTPARRDQEHLRVIIDNNPTIPDRGPAILGEGEDPTSALVATAQNLERAGADVIAIPCNTAHFFYDAVQAAVSVPVLHIMRAVARAALEGFPDLRRVGLLATAATVRAGLYQEALRPRGVEVLAPGEAGQRVINELIYAVKAQAVTDDLRAQAARVGRELVARGAEVVVFGCTELPLALHEAEVGIPTLDSTVVLAGAAVRWALRPDPEEAGHAPMAASGPRRSP